MNNLNQASSMETSGGDITRINFDFSIDLTGLEMITTYYYRVIVMNDGSGVTQSDTGTFNTTLLLVGECCTTTIHCTLSVFYLAQVSQLIKTLAM